MSGIVIFGMTNLPIVFISISYILRLILHRQSFPEDLAVLLFYVPSKEEHQEF